MSSPSPVYVIGHVNPDTDSIASAIGYAWLIRERDGIDAVAGRAGAVNSQTSWVLKTLRLEPPILITDASPRFSSVVRRLDSTTPDVTLRVAWTLANRTGGIAPVLNSDGTPYGLITGRSLFNYLGKLVGSNLNKPVALDKILDLPCGEASDVAVSRYQVNAKIRDVINRILREEGDEVWVVDENGRYVGICRQKDLLNPPRLKVILVDHNEPSQSVASLEDAELLEILDHHRLGNPSTHHPIKMTVDIVGSTSTLVSERIEESGLSAPHPVAGLMLAGLLSDTLILTSPTTTERDKDAAKRLARWAFTPGGTLAGETIKSFGEKILSSSAGLGNRSPEEIVSTDMKIYTAGGLDFAIAQAEVSDLNEVTKHLDPLNEALEILRKAKNLDFAMLMVTDVVRGSSRIIFSNPPVELEELPYLPQPDNTKLAEGVVSRKKQLLPVVLGLLEK
jgi:manganese-dependent inorganic pyrophosphatase